MMISNQFLSDVLSGNEDAIQMLIRTHQRPVFQLALSILDDASAPAADTVAEAETATRDTFMRAIDRLASYREDTPFNTWLYRIAIEIAIRRARSLRLRRGLARLVGIRPRKDTRAASAGEAPLYEGQQADDALWKSVRGLNDKLRVTVVLRYYHDFSIQEIARLLRLSEGAVHARLDQAREKMAASTGMVEQSS